MDSVQPAQLSFLAIYNPSLGQSDETLYNQLVYYYPPKSSRGRKSAKIGHDNVEQTEHEENNERLRQIGLAQGMVELAKAFSDRGPVDSIDAEKSRILLHEIEPGWWMLASVSLTRIELAPQRPKAKSNLPSEPTVDYSAREVAPHGLLLQQLLRAHSIFLLHHGHSLADIFTRLTRQNFCATLERFWNRFARDWDVLLHGSPAVDIFNGVKVAAGGELGIGVGEEEWGSGEREVLEGFIGRTEGLVDVVVSRFGEAEGGPAAPRKDFSRKSPWFGSGKPPRHVDGVIFSGIGNATRRSVRDVSAWMEWIFKYGQSTYGVMDSPHSARRKRRRKPNAFTPEVISSPAKFGESVKHKNEQVKATKSTAIETPTGIPPPIVRAADSALQIATSRAENSGAERDALTNQTDPQSGTDTFVKYMTLGIYGSNWGIPAGRPRSHSHTSEARQSSGAPSEFTREDNLPEKPREDESPNPALYVDKGCFLIGLQGDLDEEGGAEESLVAEAEQEGAEESNWNQRIMFRTLYLERKRSLNDDDENCKEISPEASPFEDRLRVIIYVRRPFIFTFLFENHTASLSYAALYRSLHHQLGPLQQSLLRSTAPATAAERHTATLASPRTTSASPPLAADSQGKNPIYDLFFEPEALSVHSSLPGIPDIEELLLLEEKKAEGGGSAGGRSGDATTWTRTDALNVHSQILSTWEATRRRKGERERTAKTSRGWWVVWMRLPRNTESASEKRIEGGELTPKGSDTAVTTRPATVVSLGSPLREAFLVRKAGDYLPTGSGKSSSSKGGGYGFGIGGKGQEKESAWGGAGKLAEGIGIDARRYVEGLFNLNR